MGGQKGEAALSRRSPSTEDLFKSTPSTLNQLRPEIWTFLPGAVRSCTSLSTPGFRPRSCWRRQPAGSAALAFLSRPVLQSAPGGPTPSTSPALRPFVPAPRRDPDPSSPGVAHPIAVDDQAPSNLYAPASWVPSRVGPSLDRRCGPGLPTFKLPLTASTSPPSQDVPRSEASTSRPPASPGGQPGPPPTCAVAGSSVTQTCRPPSTSAFTRVAPWQVVLDPQNNPPAECLDRHFELLVRPLRCKRNSPSSTT
jgi:hypothetical protein